MSKAVLLLEMPENCSACRMMCEDRDGYYCRSANICLNGVAWSGRAAGCPLKGLPEKRRRAVDIGSGRIGDSVREMCDRYYTDGYNQCLRDIGGLNE